MQRKTKEVFSSLPLQIFFSLVILASFITAIISAETKVDPNSPTGKFFNGLETTYLVIFTVVSWSWEGAGALVVDWESAGAGYEPVEQLVLAVCQGRLERSR